MSSEVTTAIQALPDAFLPEKAGNAKALILLDLTGQSAGKWVLDVSGGQCEVRDEVLANPDVTVTMDADDFVALLDNRLDPVRAFMGGKIRVSGNLGMVMQFLAWFKRGS